MGAAHNYLRSMPQDKIDQLGRSIERLLPLLSFGRVILGGVATCICGLIYVVIWVNQTTTALAESQKEIRAIASDRAATVQEWGQWRVRKDEVDTKVVQMLDMQQQLIQRQQVILDRVTLR